ncbi:MAG: hypothetical protein AAGE76_07980 [Pseudomonadota bacterium]
MFEDRTFPDQDQIDAHLSEARAMRAAAMADALAAGLRLAAAVPQRLAASLGRGAKA